MTRPKQLLFPSHYKKLLAPINSNGVWFIPPDATESFQIEPNDQTYLLEIGSGNGSWICEKARANPLKTYIAVEKQFSRVRKIWSKKQNYDLHNLFIICGTAEHFLKLWKNKNVLLEVYVNFPDPWPKRRHAPRRLLNTCFLDILFPFLQKDALIYFVTDDRAYSSSTIHLFLQDNRFTFIDPSPYYVNNIEDYGTSYFEQLWREKKRIIYYHRLKRR